MSIFQLQEWWSVKVSSNNEEFDYGCMAIGNIDNAANGHNKIAIGSQQGLLRIYYPSHPTFHIDDLMIEESFHKPILQLLIGNFVSGAPNVLALAILFPKHLSVYEVIANFDGEGKINFYSLEKLYEHNLGVEGKHFTSFNMIRGSYHGVAGKEIIIVQSMDGKLQVFDQSSAAFTSQLIDCVLPGPICYFPRIDAIVTTTNANFLECYSYQTLASSGISQTNQQRNFMNSEFGAPSTNSSTNFVLKPIKTALAEWDVNIGETCKQISEGFFSNIATSSTNKDDHHQSSPKKELLVLGEKTVFIIKESGKILQQMRLETKPCCVCVYPIPDQKSDHLDGFLLASEDNTIRVYREFNLIWATKVMNPPVQMQVAEFGGVKGLVVTIDEQGMLCLNYLGTRPPLTSAPSSISTKDINYDKVEEEHKKLIQIIRESQNEVKNEPIDHLQISISLNRKLDTDIIYDIEEIDSLELSSTLATIYPQNRKEKTINLSHSNELVKLSGRIVIGFDGESRINDISISSHVSEGIVVEPSHFSISSLQGNKHGKSAVTPLILKFYVLCSKEYLCVHSKLNLFATYLTTSGEPRVAKVSYTIPLYLYCQPRPPDKNAQYNIIIESSHSTSTLVELFDDFLNGIQQSNILDLEKSLGNAPTQALGFQFYAKTYVNLPKLMSFLSDNRIVDKNNFPINEFLLSDDCDNNVSVLTSKNAGGKFRIQADSMASLQIIAFELKNRLLVKSNLNMTLTTTSNIPIEEFQAIIELHFQLRLHLVDLLSNLNDRSHQFRMIQKRLLLRFKEKTPSKLLGMDVIMHETFQEIIQLGEEVEDYQMKLNHVSNDLTHVSKLVIFIASIKYNLSLEDHEILESVFCVDKKVDSLEQVSKQISGIS